MIELIPALRTRAAQCIYKYRRHGFSTNAWRSYPRIRARIRPQTPVLDLDPSSPPAQTTNLPPEPPKAPEPAQPKLTKQPVFKASKADKEEGFVYQPIQPTITSTAYRWDTLSPTKEQLKYAEHFFEKYTCRFLWAADEFAKMPDGAVPEVAFLGRSNVGKSSILNALMHQKGLARTSSKPGRTRKMNAFSIGEARMTLLDMPGYGYGSQKSWGLEIMEYLKGRKQFRRAFLLIDPLHGIKDYDLMILESFAQMGIPYQVVVSKSDRLETAKAKKSRRYINEVFIEIEKAMAEYGGNAGLGEVIATAADASDATLRKKGINELRYAILVAAGLDGKRR